MSSHAALRLQHMRKQHIYTLEHNRRITAAGLDKHIRGALAATGRAGADPGLVAEIMEQHQRKTILAFISTLAAAAPDAKFCNVEFNFVTIGIPNAFAAHVVSDESYAIGLDHAAPVMLNILFVAALIAYDKKDFSIFASCAAEIVGCLFNIKHFFDTRNDDDFAAGMYMLHQYYRQSSRGIQEIIDGFGISATHFIVAHELGHIQLGHFQKQRVSALQLSNGDAQTDVSAFPDHACEFEADLWAAEWLLKSAGTDVRQQTFAVIVPFLCFTILTFTSRLHEPAVAIGRLLRSTHPPDAARASRLADYAGRQLHVPPTNALDMLVKLTSFLQDEIRARM